MGSALILAVASLAACLGLGTWGPWKDSDRPGLWLILASLCGYAALWFGLPLFLSVFR